MAIVAGSGSVTGQATLAGQGTGSQADFVSRLQGMLPPWFGDFKLAPNMNGLLNGIAAALSLIYGLIAYAKQQTRIKTATDGWLDMIAGDWFGVSLQRRTGQTDASYRALIVSSLLRPRGTRNAVTKVLQDVTGRTPLVVEPRRIVDTGGYGAPGYGYGVSGVYGSRSLPVNVAFVVAYRPLAGSLQYGAQDSDIYAAVNSVRAATNSVFVQINN
jgi:hypothetical protein